MSPFHDDVINWKHFPRYCPFVRWIPRSPVNSPHKGQWHGALVFFCLKRLSKQLGGWLFETPSGSLWRNCNVKRYNTFYTLGNPFAHPGNNITHPFCYLRGKCSFDWFNQYLCTGEHFQSDLDTFQFDFMFVKPHDVPPLLCCNAQTEIRFWLQQLLLPEGRHCKQELS